MVSQSHSYVVGTWDEGDVLTHNPETTTTPPPTLPGPPYGYSLRHQRPADPPAPSLPGPPVLPADVPRRDDDGNWLIYLYEEGTLVVVENARYAVEEANQPWRLTYDPSGAHARRSQSTGQYQSQRELLQLTTTELAGGSGVGQLDRDEYPPAIAREGGTGAVVTYIEAGDNRRAGSLMGQQFANYRADPQPDGHAPLRPGDTFRYAIIHENMAAVEYLGDGHGDETQIERPPTD
ncbi:uncharacterized protein F4822DRAFT_425082 [Hypoxylon trugodes]|uniref:uncharacterized protein n=1 Tax=Hypoxylon trugodes TaxID=326681 RepID=UPI00219D41DC|nr:uncharacterized protein F4822DRAFT_425082 [Hypoxylon trugodes]KAI1391860.1 hypothetical protein F4822DRAFT_425082 [Hypoxylon trugodes]